MLYYDTYCTTAGQDYGSIGVCTQVHSLLYTLYRCVLELFILTNLDYLGRVSMRANIAKQQQPAASHMYVVLCFTMWYTIYNIYVYIYEYF